MNLAWPTPSSFRASPFWPLIAWKYESMNEPIDRLLADLNIAEAMVSEMADYLDSDVLFWPMERGGLPKLTIGGFLLRYDRLTKLRSSLPESERRRLETVSEQFEAARKERVVRFEERANAELHTRLRQWNAFLRDLQRDNPPSIHHYAAAVETRVVIAVLLTVLEQPPYRLDESSRRELSVLDGALRRSWRSSEFVWAAELEPAYPEDECWWLYGHPL